MHPRHSTLVTLIRPRTGNRAWQTRSQIPQSVQEGGSLRTDSLPSLASRSTASNRMEDRPHRRGWAMAEVTGGDWSSSLACDDEAPRRAAAAASRTQVIDARGHLSPSGRAAVPQSPSR